ncbi:hypothetical protein AAZX31_05G069500 [Glycine max]|uniref:RRM domain-containing protein n=2 Tax=Glycine subgen. Soja TaxID=1462606 RepID=K7KNC3_SOYBN|nr:hypothetical protein JHK87_011963 [Glycine soja]KAG5039914.1 hypothetical protein JHK85_012390 [Glycine max]KAG5057065.1 hypothetical protein JHK86_012061 [Glycine max]KAG5154099.1 hypothetical protein JHK82_012068 [Glycine max]KAH1133195.1 hypothetical protein GYH30_011858 [Glycine max]
MSPPSLVLSLKTKARSRLSFNTTQQQLKKLFSPFRLVTQALDPITKRPKGFSFVSFKSEIEAEKAFKAINGRIIFSYLYPL